MPKGDKPREVTCCSRKEKEASKFVQQRSMWSIKYENMATEPGIKGKSWLRSVMRKVPSDCLGNARNLSRQPPAPRTTTLQSCPAARASAPLLKSELLARFLQHFGSSRRLNGLFIWRIWQIYGFLPRLRLFEVCLSLSLLPLICRSLSPRKARGEMSEGRLLRCTRDQTAFGALLRMVDTNYLPLIRPWASQYDFFAPSPRWYTPWLAAW